MAMGSGSSDGFYKARVKSVPSGDSLVVMANSNFPPREKTITLSSLIAPRLARKDTRDEPYAWASREFLRKLLIGKDITFRTDYTVPTIGREFATVLAADGSNVALAIVQNGWAKVRQPSNAQSSQASPKIQELILAEEDAKSRGVGLWNKAGSAEAIRNLNPAAFDSSLFDAHAFVQKYKGQRLRGIVENVRDGSAMRFLSLNDSTTFLAHLTGLQCPSAGRRAPPAAAAVAQPTADEATTADGAPVVADDAAAKALAAAAAARPSPPTLASIAALSISSDIPPQEYGLEAKHYVELNVLHREVDFVPEHCNNNNVFGSIYFKRKDQELNLGHELIKESFGKFFEGSARALPDAVRLQFKASDLQAKKERVRIWTNFVPPPSNTSAVKNDEFVGTVVELVSADCMIVAEDAGIERRLNLSSVRVPKIRGAEGAEPWAVEGKEFLRSRLVGSQVAVSLEYSRSVQMPSGEGNRVLQFGTIIKIGCADGPAATAAVVPAAAGGGKSRPGTAKGQSAAASVPTEPGLTTLSIRGTNYVGVNVAELVLLNGFGNAERHRDFDEQSRFYEALYAAEQTAIKAKRGIHSGTVPNTPRLADLTDMAQAKARGKAVLASIQRLSTNRLQAVVEYVMSGHRLKLLLPSQSCRVFFSLSGVRCPGKGEPFSDDAMAFTRRRALQRDVEVHVEAQDKTGTFLGSCFVGGKSLALTLVEAGLARRLPSFGGRQVRGEEELAAAEAKAKERKLKIWEKYVEGQEDGNQNGGGAGNGNGSSGGAWGNGGGAGQVLQGRCSEVLVGGEFYFHDEKERRMFESVESQLAATDFSTPSPPGFAPKRGEMVAARWSDQSWCRAAVLTSNMSASAGSSEVQVHFVDYGNKDTVTLANIRPIPPALAGTPALAHLARLAYVKVPSDEDGWGSAAGAHLHELFQAEDGGTRPLIIKVEEREYIAGKGQVLLVTVSFADVPAAAAAGIAGTVNGLMMQAGYARIDKKAIGRISIADRSALETQEEEAKKQRVGIWQYGHIDSDDEEADLARSRGGGGGRRGAR